MITVVQPFRSLHSGQTCLFCQSREPFSEVIELPDRGLGEDNKIGMIGQIIVDPIEASISPGERLS